MAHQYMPKIFHDPHKNPLGPRPTYLMYGPLENSILKYKEKGHILIMGDLNSRTGREGNMYHENNKDQ